MPTHFRRFAAGALLASLAATVAADTLSIRADNWFPMNGDPNSDHPGYMIEMATAIMAEHGVSIDYRTMPWKRALESVRNGAFDCVVGAYKEDAPDFAYPDAPWGMDQPMFYVVKGSPWKYAGLESLADQKVGVIGGYAYEEAFDKHVEAHQESAMFQVLSADNALEQNIKKLLAQRITTTVESHLVMAAKLKELQLVGSLVKAGALRDPIEMYIACTPDNKRTATFAQQLGEGTKKLRTSGKLKEILDRYGLDDWQ